MSILKASCCRCANDAGENGFECDRCAALQHAILLHSDRDEHEFFAACPACNSHVGTVGGTLELCQKCGEEFIALEEGEEASP